MKIMVVKMKEEKEEESGVIKKGVLILVLRK